MSDRDAFIVICWMGIIVLFLFECFYRKLKARVNRDIQRTTTFIMEASTIQQSSGSRRFENRPVSIACSKEVFIRFEMDDEEPPPSYAEALSYAALVTKENNPFPEAEHFTPASLSTQGPKEDGDNDDIGSEFEVELVAVDLNNNNGVEYNVEVTYTYEEERRSSN